nr:hypothetical protein [Nocardia sp. MDA0666]
MLGDQDRLPVVHGRVDADAMARIAHLLEIARTVRRGGESGDLDA